MIASVIALAACDVPPSAPPSDPARVVSTSPAAGDEGVDRRTTLLVRFDRPILPRSIDGTTVRVFSGERRVALALRADPLLPGIVVTLRATLDPETLWRLRVDGVRDLDGVAAMPHEISFRTSWVATPPVTRALPSWADTGPLLARACGSCHGGERPVLGLDLATAEGIRRTAINVSSRQVAPAPTALGAPFAAGLAGMRRIEVRAGIGIAEQSYLVYKLIGDPHIGGSIMPPPGDAGVLALSADEVERIAGWIRGGAPTE